MLLPLEQRVILNHLAMHEHIPAHSCKFIASTSTQHLDDARLSVSQARSWSAARHSLTMLLTALSWICYLVLALVGVAVYVCCTPTILASVCNALVRSLLRQVQLSAGISIAFKTISWKRSPARVSLLPSFRGTTTKIIVHGIRVSVDLSKLPSPRPYPKSDEPPKVNLGAAIFQSILRRAIDASQHSSQDVQLFHMPTAIEYLLPYGYLFVQPIATLHAVISHLLHIEIHVVDCECSVVSGASITTRCDQTGAALIQVYAPHLRVAWHAGRSRGEESHLLPRSFNTAEHDSDESHALGLLYRDTGEGRSTIDYADDTKGQYDIEQYLALELLTSAKGDDSLGVSVSWVSALGATVSMSLGLRHGGAHLTAKAKSATQGDSLWRRSTGIAVFESCARVELDQATVAIPDLRLAFDCLHTLSDARSVHSSPMVLQDHISWQYQILGRLWALGSSVFPKPSMRSSLARALLRCDIKAFNPTLWASFPPGLQNGDNPTCRLVTHELAISMSLAPCKVRPTSIAINSRPGLQRAAGSHFPLSLYAMTVDSNEFRVWIGAAEVMNVSSLSGYVAQSFAFTHVLQIAARDVRSLSSQTIVQVDVGHCNIGEAALILRALAPFVQADAGTCTSPAAVPHADGQADVLLQHNINISVSILRVKLLLASRPSSEPALCLTVNRISQTVFAQITDRILLQLVKGALPVISQYSIGIVSYYVSNNISTVELTTPGLAAVDHVSPLLHVSKVAAVVTPAAADTPETVDAMISVHTSSVALCFNRTSMPFLAELMESIFYDLPLAWCKISLADVTRSPFIDAVCIPYPATAAPTTHLPIMARFDDVVVSFLDNSPVQHAVWCKSVAISTQTYTAHVANEEPFSMDAIRVKAASTHVFATPRLQQSLEGVIQQGPQDLVRAGAVNYLICHDFQFCEVPMPVMVRTPDPKHLPCCQWWKGADIYGHKARIVWDPLLFAHLMDSLEAIVSSLWQSIKICRRTAAMLDARSKELDVTLQQAVIFAELVINPPWDEVTTFDRFLRSFEPTGIHAIDGTGSGLKTLNSTDVEIICTTGLPAGSLLNRLPLLEQARLGHRVSTVLQVQEFSSTRLPQHFRFVTVSLSHKAELLLKVASLDVYKCVNATPSLSYDYMLDNLVQRHNALQVAYGVPRTAEIVEQALCGLTPASRLHVSSVLHGHFGFCIQAVDIRFAVNAVCDTNRASMSSLVAYVAEQIHALEGKQWEWYPDDHEHRCLFISNHAGPAVNRSQTIWLTVQRLEASLSDRPFEAWYEVASTVARAVKNQTELSAFVAHSPVRPFEAANAYQRVMRDVAPAAEATRLAALGPKMTTLTLAEIHVIAILGSGRLSDLRATVRNLHARIRQIPHDIVSVSEVTVRSTCKYDDEAYCTQILSGVDIGDPEIFVHPSLISHVDDILSTCLYCVDPDMLGYLLLQLPEILEPLTARVKSCVASCSFRNFCIKLSGTNNIYSSLEAPCLPLTIASLQVASDVVAGRASVSIVRLALHTARACPTLTEPMLQLGAISAALQVVSDDAACQVLLQGRVGNCSLFDAYNSCLLPLAQQGPLLVELTPLVLLSVCDMLQEVLLFNRVLPLRSPRPLHNLLAVATHSRFSLSMLDRWRSIGNSTQLNFACDSTERICVRWLDSHASPLAVTFTIHDGLSFATAWTKERIVPNAFASGKVALPRSMAALISASSERKLSDLVGTSDGSCVDVWCMSETAGKLPKLQLDVLDDDLAALRMQNPHSYSLSGRCILMVAGAEIRQSAFQQARASDASMDAMFHATVSPVEISLQTPTQVALMRIVRRIIECAQATMLVIMAAVPMPLRSASTSTVAEYSEEARARSEFSRPIASALNRWFSLELSGFCAQIESLAQARNVVLVGFKSAQLRHESDDLGAVERIAVQLSDFCVSCCNLSHVEVVLPISALQYDIITPRHSTCVIGIHDGTETLPAHLHATQNPLDCRVLVRPMRAELVVLVSKRHKLLSSSSAAIRDAGLSTQPPSTAGETLSTIQLILNIPAIQAQFSPHVFRFMESLITELKGSISAQIPPVGIAGIADFVSRLPWDMRDTTELLRTKQSAFLQLKRKLRTLVDNASYLQRCSPSPWACRLDPLLYDVFAQSLLWPDSKQAAWQSAVQGAGQVRSSLKSPVSPVALNPLSTDEMVSPRVDSKCAASEVRGLACIDTDKGSWLQFNGLEAASISKITSFSAAPVDAVRVALEDLERDIIRTARMLHALQSQISKIAQHVLRLELAVSAPNVDMDVQIKAISIGVFDLGRKVASSVGEAIQVERVLIVEPDILAKFSMLSAKAISFGGKTGSILLQLQGVQLLDMRPQATFPVIFDSWNAGEEILETSSAPAVSTPTGYASGVNPGLLAELGVIGIRAPKAENADLAAVDDNSLPMAPPQQSLAAYFEHKALCQTGPLFLAGSSTSESMDAGSPNTLPLFNVTVQLSETLIPGGELLTVINHMEASFQPLRVNLALVLINELVATFASAEAEPASIPSTTAPRYLSMVQSRHRRLHAWASTCEHSIKSASTVSSGLASNNPLNGADRSKWRREANKMHESVTCYFVEDPSVVHAVSPKGATTSLTRQQQPTFAVAIFGSLLDDSFDNELLKASTPTSESACAVTSSVSAAAEVKAASLFRALIASPALFAAPEVMSFSLRTRIFMKYIRIGEIHACVSFKGSIGGIDTFDDMIVKLHTRVYHSQTLSVLAFLVKLRNDIIMDVLGQPGRNFRNIGVFIANKFRISAPRPRGETADGTSAEELARVPVASVGSDIAPVASSGEDQVMALSLANPDALGALSDDEDSLDSSAAPSLSTTSTDNSPLLRLFRKSRTLVDPIQAIARHRRRGTASSDQALKDRST
jgi:hypothetical protein